MDYVIDKLEVMNNRLTQIDEQLAKITDFNQAKKLNQERSLLEESVLLYRQFIILHHNQSRPLLLE